MSLFSSHADAELHKASDAAADRDWPAITAQLDQQGYAVVHALLHPAQCQQLIAYYAQSTLFRKRVVMARHGFGQGEYQYFAYPLPALVAQLRSALYRRVMPIANRWNRAMQCAQQYPERYTDYLSQCHAAGQTLPTPLLLKYQAEDYNCLHQDVYGEHVFPLQMAVLLSEPEVDFVGGEFVITEQRPRMQSKVHVVPLRRGDAVIFAVQHKPVMGGRGVYKVQLRHGVSRIRAGHRYSLGLILHEAQT